MIRWADVDRAMIELDGWALGFMGYLLAWSMIMVRTIGPFYCFSRRASGICTAPPEAAISCMRPYVYAGRVFRYDSVEGNVLGVLAHEGLSHDAR